MEIPKMQQKAIMRISSIRIALDVVADFWTLLILRELFVGATQWRELEERLETPPATLNKRLKSLVDVGCIEKVKLAGRKGSAYHLTEMGKDLFPFQMASREWQLKWDPRPGVFVTPWVHRCGHPLRCRDVCGGCGEEISNTSIRLQDDGTPEFDYAPPPSRYQRSSGSAARDARAKGSAPPKVVEVIGNRRSSLIMAAILRGSNRFEDILNYAQLPPGTLSDRLKRLQLLDVIHSRLYQRHPDRHEYLPNEAGLDLVFLSLQLLGWSNRWLRKNGAGTTRAIHTGCGQVIESRLVCAHCGTDVRLDDCTLSAPLDRVGHAALPAAKG